MTVRYGIVDSTGSIAVSARNSIGVKTVIIRL